MADYVQERFNGVVVGVNSSFTITSGSTGGFLCQTSGTITLTKGNSATPLVTAFPVNAGTWYPLPFLLGIHGGAFTTAGGASGTLAYG